MKNPFGDNKEPESKKKKFEANQLFSHLDGGAAGEPPEKPKDKRTERTGGEESVQPAKVKVALVKDEEDDVKTEKPPMDLFKAIFANSDSESEDESDQAKDEEVEVEEVEVSRTKNDREKSPEKSKPSNGDHQARGIFAGIDFDKFIKRRRKTPPPIVRERVATTKPKSILDRSVRTILGIKSAESSDDEYGPKLPPPARTVEKIVISSNSDSDEWEEKSKKKKEKKEKKKKKDKKKKKKKNKHKSKD